MNLMKAMIIIVLITVGLGLVIALSLTISDYNNCLNFQKMVNFTGCDSSGQCFLMIGTDCNCNIANGSIKLTCDRSLNITHEEFLNLTRSAGNI